MHQHLKLTESIAHQLTSGTSITRQLMCLCVPEVVGCLMWFTLYIYNLMYPQLNLSVRAMRLSFTSTVHVIPFFTIPHFPRDPLFNLTSTRVVCCPVFSEFTMSTWALPVCGVRKTICSSRGPLAGLTFIYERAIC